MEKIVYKSTNEEKTATSRMAKIAAKAIYTLVKWFCTAVIMATCVIAYGKIILPVFSYSETAVFGSLLVTSVVSTVISIAGGFALNKFLWYLIFRDRK